MKLPHKLFTHRSEPVSPPPVIDPRQYTYDTDGLRVWNKSIAFMNNPRFVAAYQKGIHSGHKFGGNPSSSADLHIEWRVHTILWAATQAIKLPGDFVECGVNTGIYSLAVCEYLDFNHTDKTFYLFDTYSGIPLEQINENEKTLGLIEQNAAYYEECYEIALRNFSPYPKAVLIKGKVPDTLSNVSISKVCYLSIDMNIVEPEIAAIEFFWDKLTPGAPIILDDYGWLRHTHQKEAMDDFAARKGVEILNLPTGQGLLLKPFVSL